MAFQPELRSIVKNDGRISMCLYTPFKMLRQHWRADSQEMESMVNSVQSCIKKAPTAVLATVDATVGVRKSLTYDHRHGSSYKDSQSSRRHHRQLPTSAFRICQSITRFLYQAAFLHPSLPIVQCELQIMPSSTHPGKSLTTCVGRSTTTPCGCDKLVLIR